MALTETEISELKNQLRVQVAHLPLNQKRAAEEQIESMSPEALETMLKQQVSAGKRKMNEKTIFRSIIDGDIPSVTVELNAAAVAVMDISPISKGHVLVIPKKPVTDAKHLPVSAFSLAKNIAKRISSLFKAKSTLIQTENKFGECVIHVIPSYTDSPLDLSAQRTKSDKEDLEKTAQLLRPKKRKPRLPLIKKEIEAKEQNNPAPSRQRRIP